MGRFSDEIRIATALSDHPGGAAGEWITVNRERLEKGPFYVRGKQGEGKSAAVLAPLCFQRLQPYTIYERGEGGEAKAVAENCRDVMLVIDPGGDLGLYNSLKFAAEKNDRPFLTLSIDPEHDACSMNVLQLMGGSPIRVVTGIIRALGLDYGLGYGKLHYSVRPYDALLPVAKLLLKSKGEATLEDVVGLLKQQKVKDAEDIRTLFEILSCYPQLFPSADPTRNIDFREAYEKRAVIYVFAPTEDEAIPARAIIGLVLECFKAAAAERYRKGLPKVHAWVSIDEFQELVGRSLALTIAQCRKRGISLDLLHQFSSQLETEDVDLTPIVRESSIAKLYFSFSHDDIEREILTFSRDDHIWRQSLGELGQASVHEHVEPSAKKDAILDVHGTSRHCLLLIDDGTGFREACAAKTHYLFDEATYERLASTPIPWAKERTPVALMSDQPMTEARIERIKRAIRIQAERQKVLDPLGYAGTPQG